MKVSAVSLVKFPSRQKKKKLSHAAAAKIHFKNRFFERVGYKLTNALYDELLANVAVQGKFLYKDRETASVYGITFRGEKLRIVFDPFKGILHTVLPQVTNTHNER